MSEFEEVIEELGAFGPYQVRVFVLVSLFETPAAWAMVLSVFTHAIPQGHCSPAPHSLNLMNLTGANESLPTRTNTSMASNTSVGMCLADNSVCPGAVYDSSFTSIVTEWGLLCGYDYIPSLTMTMQMVGVLVGACITGQLADTFGRRRCLYLVYTLMLLSSLFSGFANDWRLYTVLKFLTGAFIGGTMVINFVLPMEFIGPRWRTFCGCIGFWACGIMSLALLAYLIRDWQHLTITTAVLGLPLLLTWWYVPESARWLVQKGRIPEAETILTEMAYFNKKPVPDLSRLHAYSQRELHTQLEHKRYSYLDLFRNLKMAKNTLIVIYAWFVSSSVYYGTKFNVKNLAGDRYLNFFISGAVEIPALVVVVLVNNCLGRRKTLFMMFLLAGVSCCGILVVEMLDVLDMMPQLTVSLAMIGQTGIAGGWAAIQVFSAEIFPTVVRNIGIGCCSMSARIGGIVAPQFVFLAKFANFLPFTIFGGLGLSCALLMLLLPETLNRPLPDTLPPASWSCCSPSRTQPSSNQPQPADGKAAVLPNSPQADTYSLLNTLPHTSHPAGGSIVTDTVLKEETSL